MFVTTAITLMCTAGVSLYLRLLVALCQECRPHRSGYWAVSDSARSKRRSLVGRSDKKQWLALAENVLNSDCSSLSEGARAHD
jgi:hypothetical protein